MSSISLVSDVMSTNVITVSPTDTLLQVRRIFNDHPVHHIPVVDENGALVGIVSSSDLSMYRHRPSVSRNKSNDDFNQEMLQSVAVSTIMSPSCKTIDAESELSEAYDEFLQGELRCLPVMEDGVLVGIVTPLDLASYPSES